MSKIDFSKAPAGATHYADTWSDGMYALWYKKVEGGYQFLSFASGMWEESGNNNSWFSEHLKEIASGEFQPFTSVEDAQPEIDMVNHPPHYQSDNGIECIDAIRAALGRDGFIAYAKGNVIKYLWREKADKLEDMRKAVWYLNRAIEEQSK